MKQETLHRGLLKLFSIVDLDGDNRVSYNELNLGFERFGFTESECSKFMRMFDKDSDGYLTLGEYKAAFGIPEDLQEESHCKVTKTMSKGALLALFEKLDVNWQDKITQEELHKGMLELGATEADVESLMSFLDMDDDGLISKNEYHVALCMSLDPEIDWDIVFEQLDCDRSGDISVTELKHVFDRIGIPIMTSGIMQWIKQHDKNNDGKLDYQEFLSFVGTQRKLSRKHK
ncbi:hypothetical protein T265_10876 [Opisthorchis viverrini]|uniref:EF-hand domain-containing protein n=1 Tax=Opisthorchis viverrini TaxID=6198 RepID=A0A074ZBL7_OPIVI|nr:hypothetical protein T265_10876 [Opisthorchis viverrini]KER20620.1 hypothetical protein T265_10876 [Opisthorchis viverrini]